MKRPRYISHSHCPRVPACKTKLEITKPEPGVSASQRSTQAKTLFSFRMLASIRYISNSLQSTLQKT